MFRAAGRLVDGVSYGLVQDHLTGTGTCHFRTSNIQSDVYLFQFETKFKTSFFSTRPPIEQEQEQHAYLHTHIGWSMINHGLTDIGGIHRL